MEERTYVRTLYGRSDGSDVITKSKFFALMGLPKSLSYGAPLARALRRARELRYYRPKKAFIKLIKGNNVTKEYLLNSLKILVPQT